jgi:acyl-CoA dehydrogenase
MDYALNRYTRRLMDWRGDCGNDAYWAGKLGRRIAGLGGVGFWHEIARRSDITVSPEPAAA